MIPGAYNIHQMLDVLRPPAIWVLLDLLVGNMYVNGMDLGLHNLVPNHILPMWFV
jgi:hypothetical protein